MKIMKWISRMDIMAWFIIVLFFYVYLMQIEIGGLLKNSIVIICIPLFMSMLGVIIKQRLKSSDIEIEIGAYDAIDNKIVWKMNKEAECPLYISLVNTCDVVVCKIWGKVEKQYDCGTFCFELNKLIRPDEEVLIGIPFECKDISNVWISTCIPFQKMTKKYFGDVTGYNGYYIWADSEYYIGEKHCVRYKTKKDGSIKLKRYWNVTE